MKLLLLLVLLPLLGDGFPSPPGGENDPLPLVHREDKGWMDFSTPMLAGVEFQVNEEDYPGGFPQWYPDIAPLSHNGFVVVWMDERNGDHDIYAQRFQIDGRPLGESIRVNEDSGSANQWNPGVASDNEGRWAVVWSDYREGGAEIYAQVFVGAERIGTNFKLSQGKEAERYYPDVAGWAGRFLVGWEDRRNGDPDIYGQLFDLHSLVGENFKLSDSGSRISQRYPQVASSGEGVFLVVWRDYRKGPPHIFGQLVERDGEALRGNFWIDDDSSGYAAWYPSVAGDSEFVVAWEEWMGKDYDVFARRYDSRGSSISDIVKVSQDLNQSEQSLPSVGAGSDGFLISWADRREGDYDIYAQRFDQKANPLGGNFRVNDDQGEASQLYPAAAYGSGGLCICWRDVRGGLAQVYAQTGDTSGQPQGSNFKPAGEVRGAHQFSPSLASEPEGLSLVVWEDYRGGKAKIYGHWINGGEFPVGDFPIQDRLCSCRQLSAQATSDGKGEFTITWMESKDGGWDVWLKRWPEIILKVNDQTIGFRGYPSLCYGEDGYLMICWVDWRGGYDIFGQVYDSDLSPVGPNFRLNDEEGDTTYRDHPWVAGARGFVAVWREHASGNSHIYGQVFDRSAHPVGGNFRVGQGQSSQSHPQVDFGGDDEFCVVWVLEEGGDEEIYAQWFNAQGLTLTAPVLVNDLGSEATQVDPAIVGHQGEYIIAWSDYREGDGDIYLQKFKGPGHRSGGNLRLNSDPGQKGQFKPSLSSSDTLLLACWEDARVPGNGYDIWAKLSSWERTGVRGEPALGPVVSSFTLSQNYPNPFNSRTVICYSLLVDLPCLTTLKIYNILGEEMRSLVESRQKPGRYQVIWGGKNNMGQDVGSGIYLYQLNVGGYKFTKKLVLLR